MRLRSMTGATIGISVIWVGSWILGLPVTQLLATLLFVPYAGATVYLAWADVRSQ
jgi:hypothetical protein